MQDYTREVYNEMFVEREREIKKEEREIGEGRTQEEKQNIKELLINLDI